MLPLSKVFKPGVVTIHKREKRNVGKIDKPRNKALSNLWVIIQLNSRASTVAQWQYACLACAKLWV